MLLYCATNTMGRDHELLSGAVLQWMRINKLKLNPNKTEVILVQGRSGNGLSRFGCGCTALIGAGS